MNTMNAWTDNDTSSTTDDRRRAPRVELRPDGLCVQLVTLADFLKLYALNVSTTGMYIQTDQTLPVGTQFDFQFVFLRDQEPLAGVGQVAWVREGADGGMGVHFVELNDAARALVETIVDAQRRELLK